MTTEDDFQAALDASPDDWQTRLILADYLQERGDPRAQGYRAIGLRRQWPRSTADGYPFGAAPEAIGERAPGRCEWWSAGKLRPDDIELRGHTLPDDWLLLLETQFIYVDQSNWLLSCDYWSRRQAEDAAALAFLKLPLERRSELLRTPEETVT